MCFGSTIPTVSIEFTEIELANLMKFHVRRRSDGCSEAGVGYRVAEKLEAAAAKFAPNTNQEGF